jgi:hypothetical protein
LSKDREKVLFRSRKGGCGFSNNAQEPSPLILSSAKEWERVAFGPELAEGAEGRVRGPIASGA